MASEEKTKKPIYKKWWFWLIVLLIIGGIGASGSSENTTPTSSNYQQVPAIEVTIPDLSTMTRDEVLVWFNSNKINGKISEEYSDNIAKGSFISQSISANTIAHEGDKLTIVYSLGKAPTLGEQNALRHANSYLSSSAFSYKSLIEQLEYEGYSHEESVYAVDNCGADWNEQAVKKAKSYMSFSSFSRTGLIEQLKYEGFTTEQAEYGVKSVGY